MKTLPLVLVFLVTGLATLSAKPIDLPDDKLHLDIPDAWTSSAPGGRIIFTATDAQNATVANLFKMPNDQGEGIDNPAFVKGIQEGFTSKVKSQGLRVIVTQEGPTVLNGVPFYNFQGRFGSEGNLTTNFNIYVTTANGQIYMLSLQSVKGSADADLQAIANSLNFTTPPVLASSNHAEKVGEKVGYYLGIFIGILAVFSILKWLRLRAQRRTKAATPN